MCPIPSTLKQLEAMPRFSSPPTQQETMCMRQDIRHRSFRNTLKVEPQALTRKSLPSFYISGHWAPKAQYLIK